MNMDTNTQLDALNTFMLGLPLGIVNALADKNADIVLATHGIGSHNGLVLREMGVVCEGVKRVLAGEDSAANLVSFIEKDQNIEDDNRPNIPQIAYEIQTNIFDVVFPLFKQAGLPLKEGRVAEPAVSPPAALRLVQVGAPRLSASEKEPARPARGQPELLSPYAPVPSPIGPSPVRPIGPIRPIASAATATPMSPRSPMSPIGPAGQKPPLEEKNIRALTRIAAGTSYTEDALRAAFEDLPQGLRQAISSVDTANAIQDIAKQYLLHVDQMAALASETGLVLLGLTHPAAFIGNLAKRLRLPEERAKEIARDISAKILVKVRDALRGLHTENPKSDLPPAVVPALPADRSAQSGIRNPKLTSSDVIPAKAGNQKTLDSRFHLPAQAGGNDSAEPPKRLNVMPLSSKGVLPSTTRNVVTTSGAPERAIPFPTGNKGSLPKATTPFSPSAKWNLGDNRQPTKEDNILTRQAAQKKEESLSREEVLHGIENPDKLKVESYKLESSPEAKLKTANLPARRSLGADWKLETPVGPTGWRPSQEASSVERLAASNDRTNQPSASELNVTPARMTEVIQSSGRYPPNDSVKTQPQSEGAPPPPKPAQEPQNFLDEKLASPARLQKEERNYTTDPYREPLDS